MEDGDIYHSRSCSGSSSADAETIFDFDDARLRATAMRKLKTLLKLSKLNYLNGVIFMK